MSAIGLTLPTLTIPLGASTNGLGVTIGKRRIITTNKYDNCFPRPNYTDPILIPEGTVDETVDLMIDIVNLTKYQTKQLIEPAKLQGKDKLDTCRRIHTFLIQNYQYAEDSKFAEQLRTPARSWADRRKGVDCDCMSITAGSILSNLKIPFKFRITKYPKSDPAEIRWQHVYVVVPDGDKEIIIDGVISEFNMEKEYLEQKSDYNMKGLDRIN